MRTWADMRSRWVDWCNLVLGAWLFVSPWVLHTTSGTGNTASPGDFWWVGAAIFIVALWAILTPMARWTEWINAILAVWLFISPWVLGFADVPRAAWDAWIVGIVVFVLALSAFAVARRTPLRRGPIDMDNTGLPGGRNRSGALR